jgi:RNA polymerase sigma-70 factor (ECF subfamily)
MDQDQDLARRAAAGDAAAFAALVRAHEEAVRRFLRRLVRDNADTDDLAQDVFLKAWRTGARWRGDSTYRTWLLGVAWTTFLDARRAGTRRAARETAAFHENRVDADPDRAIDLARALAALGERERAAALLCFGEGCSHDEAARILGLPLGTLKSVLARSRTALTARLEVA